MTNPMPESENLTLGYVGIITAVVIWAGWIVATRAAMNASYAPLDVALIRYGIPAVMLAPIWLRKGIFPKGENPLLLAIMTIGWGGPFVVLISKGLQTVPASLFGPLVPGLLPMVVAFWGFFILRERISKVRGVGLLFIAAAVALVVVPAALAVDGADFLDGVPWLLTACLGWSSFTIAFRYTGLSGLESAAYVCLYSSPFLLLAVFLFGSELDQFSSVDVLTQGLVQGVLSGTISVAAYGFAVKTLGLARASAFTSLVPVLATIGGWSLLGETVSAAGWAAAACACIGVLLVNRATSRPAAVTPT
ncbi:MAG: DMT family transporter [Pikeienuella sp.]